MLRKIVQTVFYDPTIRSNDEGHWTYKKGKYHGY